MAYKMKGSPMERNFGISPVKNEKKIIEKKGTTIFGHTPKEFVSKATKPYRDLYKFGKKSVRVFGEAVNQGILGKEPSKK
mgnify:CR=1 FL=1